jgi:hypothetical protein
MAVSENGVILVWGLPSTALPACVVEAEARGAVRVDRVATPYAAAAQLIRLGAFARAILVDPALLTQKSLGPLAMLQRHALVPIIAVPGGEGKGNMRSVAGVMAWDESSSLIGRILQPHGPSPHPPGAEPPDDSPGKSVTSPADQRYDDLDAGPLLTEQEMRALLGSPE